MSNVSPDVCDQTTVEVTVNEPSQKLDEVEPKDMDEDDWDDFGDFAEPVVEEISDEKDGARETSGTVVEITTVITDGDDDWDDFADFQEATGSSSTDPSVTHTADNVPPSTAPATTNRDIKTSTLDKDTFAQNLANTDRVTRLITNAFSLSDDVETDAAEVTLENDYGLSRDENKSANA